MGTLADIRIGVCNIVYKGINLGHTKEGVTFRYEPELADLTVDQYGTTPVDLVLTGETLEVVATLAEPSIQKLDFALASAKKEIGASETRLDIGHDAGYSLRDSEAGVLVLHPIKNDAANLDEDVTIYKAVSNAAVELAYKVDEQRVYEVTFRALIDESYSDTRRLGHIGPANIS